MKTITEYEILDHGVYHAQYFQGCGVSFSRFDVCVTGCGFSSRKEAIDDALEQLAIQGYTIPEELLQEAASAPNDDIVDRVVREGMDPTIYRVSFRPYCGMDIPDKDFDTLEEARGWVAHTLKRARKEGFPVRILTDGDPYTTKGAWEIQEPEDCLMVPDECGVLRLEVIEQEYPEDSELYYYVSIRVKTE